MGACDLQYVHPLGMEEKRTQFVIKIFERTHSVIFVICGLFLRSSFLVHSNWNKLKQFSFKHYFSNLNRVCKKCLPCCEFLMVLDFLPEHHLESANPPLELWTSLVLEHFGVSVRKSRTKYSSQSYLIAACKSKIFLEQSDYKRQMLTYFLFTWCTAGFEPTTFWLGAIHKRRLL